MSVYRPIRIEFWTDEKVVELFSPEDKYFMLYLLTNPHTNQLGIYNFVNKIAAFELGYSVEAVSVLLDRFESKYGIIIRSKNTNEIAILNYLLHSVISGGKPLEDCINKDMKSVKDKLLIDNVFAYLSGKYISPTINNIINNYFNINNTEQEHKQEHKHKQKVADNTSTIRGQYVDNTQKDDKEPELPNIYKDVVDYLNKKANTKYRHTTPATQRHIKSRQNESFTLQDFYAVIDVKCLQWLNDKNMSKYLRPETLFGTKFESYLNESQLANAKSPVDEKTELERLKETDPVEYEKYRPAT